MTTHTRVPLELLFTKAGMPSAVHEEVAFTPVMDPKDNEYVRTVGATDKQLRDARCDAVVDCPAPGSAERLSECIVQCAMRCSAGELKCAESLSDTGATSILLTPTSARRLGLTTMEHAPQMLINTAGGQVLKGSKIRSCTVDLQTSDGQWQPFVFEDAYIVEGLVQDIAGGPAVSTAGFEAVYEPFHQGAHLQHVSGIVVPLHPCTTVKKGHYFLEMRPSKQQEGIGFVVTRSQSHSMHVEDAAHRNNFEQTHSTESGDPVAVQTEARPLLAEDDPSLAAQRDRANRNASGDSEVLTTDEARRAAMMYHHARLNHCSVSRLNQLIDNGTIKDGIKIAAIKCAACERVNATRAPHTGAMLPVPRTKVGAWVQMDIYGPFDPCPFTGYRYVMGAIDTSDGSIAWTFLRHKSDAIEGYKNLKRLYQSQNSFVEAKHGHSLTLEQVCLDRETSLITATGSKRSTFETLLHEDNVALYTSPKGTPEFNSKIEAFWKILGRKAEAAMVHAGVELQKYRFLAFSHVMHTYNRTPAGSNDFATVLGEGADAPYRTRGIPFDEGKLVPFFAPAIEWREPRKKGLAPRGHPVNVVGYESFIPGTSYQIYDPSTGVIKSSADIKIMKHHQPPGIEIQRLKDPAFDVNSVDMRNGVADNTESMGAGMNDVGGFEVRISGNKAATRTTGASLNPFAGDRLDAQRHKMMTSLAMRQSRELIAKAKAISGVRVRYDPRNPKLNTEKSGPSLSYLRYERYKSCTTLEELLSKQREYFMHRGKSELVMRPADLVFDLAHGYATLIFPPDAMDPDTQDLRNRFSSLAREWADTSSATQTGSRSASMAVGFPMHLTALAALLVSDVPVARNLADAKRSDHWPEWKAARKKELEGLSRRGMWTVIPRRAVPNGRKVFPLKEIYDVKSRLDENGNVVVDKFKHRVTFRGDRSVHGRDFFETTSAMARPESVRCCIALAAANGWSVYSVDHSQAFTNAPRDVEIFTELPEMDPEEEAETGLIGKCDEFVGLMGKTLYGEKGSGRAWMQMYDRWLIEELGAKMLIQDRQVFVWEWRGHTMYLPTHVDDTLLIASHKDIVSEFMRCLRMKFEVTGGELATEFLGMQITQERDGIRIHQTKYAHSLMDKFQLWNTTPADTPIEPNEKYVPHQGEPIDQPEYLMKVGALNWLATSTRPDLAYAMSRLARASRCPGPLDHAI
jgi:hypothetical protein